MTNRAPLVVAIVLLVLPVLYVGSYVALLRPATSTFTATIGIQTPTGPIGIDVSPANSNYRIGGEWPATLFWPLEKADRKLRPGYWE
jgi:hypothetical protein